MGKKLQYKIAIILYTSGIDYDDRIRKEILSFMKLYPSIFFKIFAIDSKNREESGVSSYGVPYRIPYLKTREKYPSGTHTIAKAWDFYKTIKNDLSEFDAIWCADPQTFIFVFMLQGKPLAWDLHELPDIFMHNPVWRILFRMMEKKVNVMVHANEARLKHLQKIGMIHHNDKQFVLRNYPQFNEIDKEYDDLYLNFEKWVGKDKCVYLQGLGGDDRADVESIQAILKVPGLKAVVVGRIDDDRMKIIRNLCGEENVENQIFFTGQVKQCKTPQYIRKCFMSLVFYKNSSVNNWYCEPNRLFQNVLNGNPVVVGNNPPMKEFVERGGFGIVVDTDGSDVSKIVDGINYVIRNYDVIKSNIAQNSSYALWDRQNDTLEQIMKKFIKIKEK